MKRAFKITSNLFLIIENGVMLEGVIVSWTIQNTSKSSKSYNNFGF